jgi:hypothetical protein
MLVLLHYYGVELHNFNPNSIAQAAIFVAVCESFLGIDPHWDLWTHLFSAELFASTREAKKVRMAVRAGVAAIRRCGASAQVAAVVSAEVVAARGGCLHRRDRQRHLRSDLRLFDFDGLSSPLVWGRGRGPFHSSVFPEVIAAVV